jgi:hypothetical protein
MLPDGHVRRGPPVTPYHIAGAINGVLFLLSLTGLGVQLATIRSRVGPKRVRGHATAVLSLNYFSVSFLAYLAFFIYGFSIVPFNHYLVWPRLVGCLLVWAVILEIARDRRNAVSWIIAGMTSLLMLGAVGFLATGGARGAAFVVGPQLLSVAATALISQSLVHQIVAVRKAGQAGAVSWVLHLLTLLKDVSTVVFGFAMGLALGWPLLLMGGASACLKGVLLWCLHQAAPTNAVGSDPSR